MIDVSNEGLFWLTLGWLFIVVWAAAVGSVIFGTLAAYREFTVWWRSKGSG